MSFKYLVHAANYGAAGTVVASESSAVYPIANIQHPRLSKVWRSNGGLSNVDIQWDLQAARAVDIIGLLNHNFTAGVTVTVNAGSTAAVSDFSETIDYREGGMYKVLPTPETYQHWRVRISDPANSYGFLEVGYPPLGLLSTAPRGVAFNPGLNTDHISDVDSMTSDGGAIFADWINDRKRITVSFAAMSKEERTALIAFIASLKEETIPVFVIPHADYYEGWYMRLVVSANERANQRHGSIGPLTFMEDGSGKRMGA